MNKIFQIGFNKCGTVSLHQYFLQNGLESIHWDKGRLAKTIKSNFDRGLPLLKGYERFDCFTDMESQTNNIFIYLTHFKELDRAYPGSKFILNIRDKNKWLQSRINHRDYLKVHQKITGLSVDDVIELWSKDWDDHLKNVKEYFIGREDDLLIFDIENDVDKLNQFMSKIIEVKSKDFKQYNVTKERIRC